MIYKKPPARNVLDRSHLLSLPVLPKVMNALLEMVNGEDIDLQKQVQWFSCDPVLSARLIAVANSSSRQSVFNTRRALKALGPTPVRALIVTTALQPCPSLPTPALNQFWRHALWCARLARRLAEITAYPDPEEAQLCGLLHDLGKLVISAHHTVAPDEVYTLGRIARTLGEVVELEQRLFAVDHCVLGAEQAADWRLPTWFADAIRFHHLNTEALRGVHPLLRLLHAANILSQGAELSEATLAETGMLLHLSPAALESACIEVEQEVGLLAAELGIAITEDEAASTPIRASLNSTRTEVILVDAMCGVLGDADDEPALREAIIHCAAMLFDLNRVHFFRRDPQTGILHSDRSAEWLDGFTIHPEGAANALQRAVQERRVCHSLDPAISPGVIDLQLARQWGCDGVWCMPLYAGERLMGILATGISCAQLPRLLIRERSWKRFAATAAAALAEREQREILQHRTRKDRDLLEQQRLRAAIHEISNPLTIVRNSLYLLSARLGEQATAEVQGLQEEIERASRILLHLVEPGDSVEESAFDLNRTIRDLAQVLDEALCRPHGIRLNLHLAEDLAPLTQGRDAIRQILLNLVRNAAEALGEGGGITVTTRDDVDLDGRRYVEIAVADNGPGLPEALRAQLFQPVVTTKGEGHAGLGLSIVKNLAKALGGQADCRPNPGGGVVFLVLLPRA